MTRKERIANLKILKSRITVFDEDDDKQVMALQETIKELEQEPKTGHWIFHEIENTLRWYECDQCGAEAVKEYDYCHVCGARMIEPQEREG